MAAVMKIRATDGGQDDQVGGDDIGGQKKEQHSLEALLLLTGYLHQGWDITEKVIQDIVTAEGQGKSVLGDDVGVKKAFPIGVCHKEHTQIHWHGLGIKQRLGDGHVEVIGH